MKTSNQLLIGLIIILFAAIFGTATVLKSEYEKIDKDNPYYGYTSEALDNFSAIRIEGKYPGLIQIQYAEKYEVKRRGSSAEEFQWSIQNDTLILTHPGAEFPERFVAERILSNKSNFYIMAPNLTAVHSASSACKLSGWQLSALRLEQQGQGSGMALTESEVDNLTAKITQGGMIRIEQPNQIKRATVEVRDVSTFTVRPSAIDSLRAEIDSTAQVTVPGYLLHQVNSSND
ncbi:MAG: hypothetical protein AAF944_18355 [Bacteroidota bacterium]